MVRENADFFYSNSVFFFIGTRDVSSTYASVLLYYGTCRFSLIINASDLPFRWMRARDTFSHGKREKTATTLLSLYLWFYYRVLGGSYA